MTSGRGVLLAALGVLAASVAYETAVAAGWLSVGPDPGEAPPGNGIVVGAALVVLVAAALVCVAASPARDPPDVLYVLLAPAAGVFVIARFYTFDPYYAPTLRRMSQDGAVPAWWVYALAALALLGAAATAIRPRVGLATTAVVLVLCGLTTLAEGSGH